MVGDDGSWSPMTLESHSVILPYCQDQRVANSLQAALLSNASCWNYVIYSVK